MDLSELNLRHLNQINRHPWELCRLKMLNYFIKHLRKEKILDVGSGDAYLSGSLAMQYTSACIVAVDTNYDEDNIALVNSLKLKNLNLTKDLYQASAILGGTADVVLLLDVLEHVQRPDLLLKSICSSNTDENTFFIITVPAYQFLFSEHDRRLGHVKRYTLKGITNLLEQNQFEIIHKGYIFNTLVPVRLLQVVWERLFNSNKIYNKGIHNWKGTPFWTKIIKNYFWIEFKICWYLARLGIYLPGLTCYCICRPLPL